MLDLHVLNDGINNLIANVALYSLKGERQIYLLQYYFHVISWRVYVSFNLANFAKFKISSLNLLLSYVLTHLNNILALRIV